MENTNYKVYIGNIENLNKLDNIDIQNLINNYNQGSLNLNSIQVFKDSIHVEIDNETEALSLANFFNNFIYKTIKLKSFVINNLISTPANSGYDNQSSSSKINRSNNKNNNIESIDCEIYVLNRQLKKYADSVNDKLCKELFGLRTHTKYLSDDNQKFEISYDFIKESFNRDLLYLVYLNEKNEQFNSINLFILNKWRLNIKNNADNINNKPKYSIKGRFKIVYMR
jgi:hypothetical protein